MSTTINVKNQTASLALLNSVKEEWARKNELDLSDVEAYFRFVEEKGLVQQGYFGPEVKIGTLDAFVAETRASLSGVDSLSNLFDIAYVGHVRNLATYALGLEELAPKIDTFRKSDAAAAGIRFFFTNLD